VNQSRPAHASFYITSLYTECLHGLPEVRIAGEGVEGVGRIGPKEWPQAILLGLDSGEWRPGHVVLQVTPDPLKGVQGRAIGRQKHQAHVRREEEPRGRRGPTVVQPEEMQAIRKGLCEGLDAELEPLGVQRGPRPNAPITRGRRHRAIDGAPREDMLDCSTRRHATGGEAPPADAQEAEAAVVLAEDPHWTRVRGWDDLLEVGSTGRLERGNSRRILGCDWAAAHDAWFERVAAPPWRASWL
jgi:hypothetical protein